MHAARTRIAGPPVDYDPAARPAGRHRLAASTCRPSLIVALVTVVLVKGIRESAGFNAAWWSIKLAAVLFVIVVGAFYVNPANWHPFAPYG